MSNSARIAARGAWGTVEWAVASSGESPALEFFEEGLTDAEKAKVLVLFQRLTETGRIWNVEQFKNLGEKAGAEGRRLYEFKRFQIRFIGAFRPGGRFIIAVGVRKKKDDLNRSDIEQALRVLAWHDERERGSR